MTCMQLSLKEDFQESIQEDFQEHFLEQQLEEWEEEDSHLGCMEVEQQEEVKEFQEFLSSTFRKDLN